MRTKNCSLQRCCAVSIKTDQVQQINSSQQGGKTLTGQTIGFLIRLSNNLNEPENCFHLRKAEMPKRVGDDVSVS